MSFTPRYITKADFLVFIKLQNPKFQTEDDIPDVAVRLAESWIDQMLLDFNLHPALYATYLAAVGCGEILWGASMAAALEQACLHGWIVWTSGDMAVEQLGKISRTYQKWQPMFFFARGAARDFYQLLPHESFRMIAYGMIRNFRLCYTRFDDDFNKKHIKAEDYYFTEDTSRGYNWNLDEEYFADDDDDSEG